LNENNLIIKNDKKGVLKLETINSNESNNDRYFNYGFSSNEAENRRMLIEYIK